MRRVTIHYSLFTIMFLLGLFQAVSGFIMWWALPCGGGGQGRGGGGGGGGGETFWSLSRDTWADLHDWVAVALLVVVIVHIILHWKWIVRMTKSYLKGKS
jgi:hypothetical protein